MSSATTILLSLPFLRDGSAATGGDGVRLGPPERFSFDGLIARARALADASYKAPYRPAPDVTEQIVYDVHGSMRFRRDHAPFRGGAGLHPVTFFPVGRYFPYAVKMHLTDGRETSEILYAPEYFDLPEDSIAHRLPADAGFAGFRIHEAKTRSDWRDQDWVAFLGASYFRAIGALGQYGLSARGVAVDTATAEAEEFPNFVEFHISPALRADQPVTVYALLDGPSVTGAFRFHLLRTEGVVMEVEKLLFLRRDVQRLGIAPLTSMFWYAEYNRRQGVDWRPEVHDSDGLALWTGAGNRLWRPLNNPRRAVTSSFQDTDPKGFGLLQRDRNVEHYLDGVNYHLRPSLWVEPLGDWGEGSVQLVEIPTDDETNDNVAAFWVPREPARAGAEHTYRYRLHWLAGMPYPPNDLGCVVATRVGRGGEPGRPRPDGVTKFVVEFAGGPIAALDSNVDVTPRVTASAGTLGRMFVEPVPETRRWRLTLDLAYTGPVPAELQAYLQLNGRRLTETWLFQHRPQ